MSKKKQKKQQKSRETQFARYAAKMWRELEAVLAVEDIEIDRWRNKKASEVAEAVLAKQLYDFADYVTSHSMFTFAKDIPDLGEDENDKSD